MELLFKTWRGILTALKYVEFDKVNYKTFSIEFLTVLLSVCSEIDIVGKMIAKYFYNEFEPEKKIIQFINGGIKFKIFYHYLIKLLILKILKN